MSRFTISNVTYQLFEVMSALCNSQSQALNVVVNNTSALVNFSNDYMSKALGCAKRSSSHSVFEIASKMNVKGKQISDLTDNFHGFLLLTGHKTFV